MSRVFCLSGIVLLGFALVLSFLVSVSLPYLPALDIARVRFGNVISVSGASSIQEIRLGIWAPCTYTPQGDRFCLSSHHGYTFQVVHGTQTATIRSAWTNGLAVHPVATGVTFVAFLCGLSTHLTLMLVASALSFLAATLTLIAFAIDIALFGLVKSEMNDFTANATTTTAPGFWLTFVSLILLLLAGCTVCFGRRKSRSGDATTTYPLRSGFRFGKS